MEKERFGEVLADADKRLTQLDSELTCAKQAHEQALLRQQEHASQTERQLEVLLECFDLPCQALIIVIYTMMVEHCIDQVANKCPTPCSLCNMLQEGSAIKITLQQ